MMMMKTKMMMWPDYRWAPHLLFPPLAPALDEVWQIPMPLFQKEKHKSTYPVGGPKKTSQPGQIKNTSPLPWLVLPAPRQKKKTPKKNPQKKNRKQKPKKKPPPPPLKRKRGKEGGWGIGYTYPLPPPPSFGPSFPPPFFGPREQEDFLTPPSPPPPPKEEEGERTASGESRIRKWGILGG